MNWSQSSVEKVAKEIHQCDERNGAGCWDFYASNPREYKSFVPDALDKAKAALSVIAELPEVRGLVDAAKRTRDYGYLKQDSLWHEINNALRPFTNKGE